MSQELQQHKADTKVSGDKRVFKASANLSRTGLEKSILEFEQAAQLMLHRMDVMLMSISSISNEKDPTKRLEVRYNYCNFWGRIKFMYNIY